MPRERARARVGKSCIHRAQDYIDRLPSELSGGPEAAGRDCSSHCRPGHTWSCSMIQRRLDPIIAATVDDELVKLRDLQHVTCLIVTHQIRDAFYVAYHEARLEGQRALIRAIPVKRADG